MHFGVFAFEGCWFLQFCSLFGVVGSILSFESKSSDFELVTSQISSFPSSFRWVLIFVWF